MVVLGLLLLVLCALLAVGIVLGNGEAVQAEAFGVSLDNVSVGGLFVVGMITGALALLGLGMMLAGAARKRAKRAAAKREVRDVRGERESLAEENARLQAELERSQQTSTTAVPHAVGRHDTASDAPGRSDARGRSDGEHFADGSVPADADERRRHRG